VTALQRLQAVDDLHGSYAFKNEARRFARRAKIEGSR
jgi:hypothetical protein